ncbi:hypothetical protein KI387_034141, partial [Taxus chinensis]
AKDKGIKNLKVQGDVKLIVNQVKGIYQVKNDWLRHYRNAAWDNIKEFDAFSIKAVLAQNDMADSLAISASLMLPHPGLKIDTYTIEVVFHPSVLDNSQHWQVFNDDNQLITFLEKADNFKELHFDRSTSLC